MNKILTWDAACFRVNGEPTPLISGEFHYFRVPKEDWRKRLLLLKESGANAVATYIPWIVHEPEEGKILFDDVPQRCLTEFLRLCNELEIMVIARPGPYSYSELCQHGLPAWLLDTYPQVLACGPDGVSHGSDRSASYLHPVFLEKARRYLRAVNGLLRPFLVTNGGCVVSVQADNEIGGLHVWFGFLDCNEEAMGFGREDGRYVRFLKEKYGEIGLLNQRYGTEYGSFCDVMPYKNTPKDGSVGEKRFAGDYLNFYRQTLEEYIRILCAWFVEDGLDVDFCTNAGTPSFLPIMRNIPEQNEQYRFFLGADHYYALFPSAGTCMTPEKMVRYTDSVDWQEALGMPPSVLEMQSGSASCYPPIFPENAHGFYMAHVALGMKGSNYYVFTGGPNFENTGNNVDIYDYHAPVSATGEVRPLYYAQKKRNEFSYEQDWLLTESRVCDVQYGFNWEQLQETVSGPWKRYSRDGLQIGRYGGSLRLTLSLAARLYKSKEIGGVLDPALPLIVACDQRMSRQKQENLVRFVENGGKLILTPVVPDLDEDYLPCTVLKDFLGVKDSVACSVGGPAVLSNGQKIYELVQKFSFPGFGGEVLCRNVADGSSIAEYKKFGEGAAVLLGATYFYSQFCQMDLLNFCIDTLGCERRVKTDCRTLAVTLFENGEKALVFLVNNLPGTVTDSFTVTANGKESRLEKISVPPFSVVSVPLE